MVSHWTLPGWSWSSKLCTTRRGQNWVTNALVGDGCSILVSSPLWVVQLGEPDNGPGTNSQREAATTHTEGEEDSALA